MASDMKELEDKSVGQDESADRDERDEKKLARADDASSASAGRVSKHGFFTIYKKGHGYWTRMGTAIAAFFLIALTAVNIYTALPRLMQDRTDPALTAQEQQIDVQLQSKTLTPEATSTLRAQRSGIIKTIEDANAARASRINTISIAAAVIFAVLLTYWSWQMMNKPDNVDFLIATDSEMKKVNWTTKKELIGSTKVVVFFMVMIAVFLFVCDLLFGYFFYLINVLRSNPFGSGTMGGG